jgi:ABC-type transport system involved in multi-copper enzyme maturation permease subunit
VSPLSEIRFVAQRELAKSFRSAKGIVLLLLSLLGGTAITLLIAWVEKMKREKMADISPEAIAFGREKVMAELFGDADTGKVLAQIPDILIAVFMLTIWLTPLLVALLGFDSVAGELQHKTVRYWSIRTRRASYVVGKWLGTWAMVSATTLLLHALIWVICISRGEAASSTIVNWGFRLWLTTLPMSAAWCALGNLVSSLFKVPIAALFVTFLAFFVLWMVYVLALRSDIEALTYVYPNAFDRLLLHARTDRWLLGVTACLGTTAGYLTLGSFLFTKRDV